VSLALAAYLFASEQCILSKRTRNPGQGHTAFLPIADALSVVPAEPASARFDGPVVVLQCECVRQWLTITATVHDQKRLRFTGHTATFLRPPPTPAQSAAGWERTRGAGAVVARRRRP
jgi:hypothetical protein